MTQEESETYDDAQRRLAESAETKEAQKQRRAAYDVAHHMLLHKSDAESPESSPYDGTRQG